MNNNLLILVSSFMVAWVLALAIAFVPKFVVLGVGML